MVRQTMELKFTASQILILNRPGAWLLDNLHSMLLVMNGEVARKKSFKFKAVSNGVLNYMAREIFPSNVSCLNDNNVGNHMEFLAWLCLENDRCDIALALAYHAFLSRPSGDD